MNRVPHVCLAIVLGLLVWSGIAPKSRFTWMLEVLPVVLALPVLIGTFRRFPLTPLAYLLITIFAAILCVGGHYTYEEVPLGNWLREWFGWKRNHYDRIGHFMQGFVPALLTREVLLRTSPLRPGKWLFTTVAAFALAISAVYELVEWTVAELAGDSADAFLGMQGDVWDTQKDMALAWFGAIVCQLMLNRWHDRQLEQLRVRPSKF